MTALGWPGRATRLRPRRRKAAVRPDILSLEYRIVPATFTVTSFADGIVAQAGAGTAQTSDGRITLRSAIQELNAEGGGTLILPAGSYTLSIIGTNEDLAAAGDLDILAPITVQGAGAGTTTIHGDGSDRIFDVRTGQDVTVSGVTLTGGRADVGGAIRSSAGSVLELDNDVLTGNQSTSDGGAVATIAPGTQGQLVLNGVLLQNNTAGGMGGALFLDGLTAIVTGATIAGNSATAGGGGVAVADSHSTRLAGLQASLFTVSGNSTAGQGGGILIQTGIVQLNDATIALNQAASGGGIQNGRTLRGANSIIAGNTAASGPDVLGSFASQGFNLIGNSSGATGTFASSDIVGTASAPIDPRLSPLVIHGGNLPVQVPLPGSPVLGAGQTSQLNDERGFARPSSGVDIGAVQHQLFSITSPSGGQHAAAGSAFGPLQAVVAEGGLPLPGVAVTFTAPASGPSGTFGGSTTIVTDTNGSATASTFTANFQTGAYSVRAGVTTSLFSDISLTNDPALTDTLKLTVTSTNVQAGVAFQLTVTALKPDGTRDGAYAGTVTFSTDSGALASLPGPTTFTLADGGQKSFQVVMGGVGTHIIHATDPGGPGGQVSVTVTPATNRFQITGPGTVVEGQPFSITVTALDSQGRPLTSFVGPVTFSSDDPRAVLPTGVIFTAADGGVKSITGFALRPPGPRTITATALDGTTGSATVNVTNIGPSGLALSTDQASIPEGSSIQLSGSFKNPDPQDTHTVDISWGDGQHIVLHLAAGVFQFQTSHTYADNPAAGTSDFPIAVTVTDAAGGSTAGNTKVAVANVAPKLPDSGGFAVADADSPLGQKLAFTDPGADTWTAFADFGDGTGPQSVKVSGHTLLLDHDYRAEGTFQFQLTLTDKDGGTATFTEQAVVFLPGTSNVKIVSVPPGGTATLTIPGATVIFSNIGGTGPAIVALGLVNLKALNGLAGSPTNDPKELVSAYDVRVLNASPSNVLTARLSYKNGAPSADPAVVYYDRTAGAFVGVRGSTSRAGSFVVDKAGHAVTVIVGDTSTPRVTGLAGTVFAVAVPAPTTSPNSGTQSTVNAGTTPFLLASAAPASPALAALDTATVAAPVPTTGLVSSSTLTVVVSAAEGLVRGGGDEPLSGRLVNRETLSTALETAIEISDFLREAFRMWLDQPAPMEAPAAIVPPPDTIDQVQLRETAVQTIVEARQVEAAPPKPGVLDALATAPPKDAVVAPAEQRPWWLTAAPVKADAAGNDQPIPIPAEHEPSTADRAGVAVTAIWLGGSALTAVLPEPAAEEDDDRPSPPPDEETGED